MADQSEPFNAVKMVTSPFTGMFWVKVLMMGLGIFVLFGGLGLIGFSVYKAFHPIQTDTYNNRAGVITNHQPAPRATFGCASVQINEYYRDRATNRTK